jgi:tetratricopeptide (TPR) repeat protein
MAGRKRAGGRLPALLERDASRWALLSPLIDELLELGEEARAVRLAELARRDATGAAELSDLLGRQRAVELEGFLEAPALGAAPGITLEGRTVGAYTIERLLGQGGMGTVWLARRSDGRFEGRAAVKFLRLGLLGSAGAARFRLEGSILARLSHPNIARLLDAGVLEGQPYLVLEHVEGRRVDEWCDAHALGIEPRIRLFLGVLDAVAHAHDRLVLHRDLKPSNILVTAEGQPKLLDFGVAKLLEGAAASGQATELTGQAGRPFTPGYAAPEQLRGEDVTTATDVYALGVVLHQLLAGTHPGAEPAAATAGLPGRTAGTSPRRASQAAARVAPEVAARRAGASPGELARALRGDLDNVLAAAISEEPGRRYPTTHALAADLRSFLAHEPVAATAGSFAYRLGKAVRRHRLAFGTAALVALALLVGVAGTTWEALEARRQRAQAVEERERADREAQRAREQRDFALRQALRTRAIADLDDFLIYEAAPNGRRFTALDLLGRAERIVTRQQDGDDPDRAELLVAVGRNYGFLEQEERSRKLLEAAYALASKGPDPSVRARAACALAEPLARLGEGARAEALVREGLSTLPEEPEFALDRIDCLRSGVIVADDVGDATEALERAQAAEALLGELPAAPGLLATRVVMDLAEANRWAGRLPDAAATFGRAAALLAAQGRDETELAGTLFNNWGVTLSQLGRPLEAEALLRRSMGVSTADGGPERISPTLLSNLARALASLARLSEAAPLVARALSIARSGHQEVAVNQILLLEASIDRQAGDLGGAERALAEVEPRLRRMLPPGHHAFAWVELERSMILRARGNLVAAREAADRAVAMGEASGQGPSLLTLLLELRAEIELDLGRLPEARSDAERALEEARTLSEGKARTLHAGKALLTRGKALRGLGDAAGARAAFDSAVAELRESVGAEHPLTRQAERLAAGR